MSRRFDYRVRLKRVGILRILASWFIVGILRYKLKSVAPCAVSSYGSSTYFGIFAKPTIDVMVVVGAAENLDIAINSLQESYPRLVEIELGGEMYPRRMLRLYDSSHRPIVNIHVVPSSFWINSFERSITELLRTDHDLRISYSYAKRYILKHGGTDPAYYGNAKKMYLSWAMSVASSFIGDTNYEDK